MAGKYSFTLVHIIHKSLLQMDCGCRCERGKNNSRKIYQEYIHLFLGQAAAAAKSLQSCPTLCNPIDGSPPGSLVPGILQARTLEWVAISFSSAWKWKVKGKSLSRARLLATPWTAAPLAPPSMGFSRQECWSGVPLPSWGKQRCTKQDSSKLLVIKKITQTWTVLKTT